MSSYAGVSSIIACETTAGKIVFELFKEWSPIGYERALGLFQTGFYDGSHFFRVIPGFLVQFGISYTNDKGLKTASKVRIEDDPQVGIEFDEGIVSFAGSGPNSRTSHLFIAYGKIPSLGKEPWGKFGECIDWKSVSLELSFTFYFISTLFDTIETPIGKVIEGIENVRDLNGEYGDGAPHGKGPPQYMIER